MESRLVEDFNADWSFKLTNIDASSVDFDHSNWRVLMLPHDWSIEGNFSKDHPATEGGGALPGGIGWYRKVFELPATDSVKKIYIDFDGIYWNSSVYLNGKLVGYRPNGYLSFRYDLTPYLNFGDKKNVIAVKVENSNQPNSRWYSGAGIYRNVRLVKTNHVHIDLWGTYITTPKVDSSSSNVNIEITINNSSAENKNVSLFTDIRDKNGKVIAIKSSLLEIEAKSRKQYTEMFDIENPELWSVDNPYLYTATTYIKEGRKLIDQYDTKFGVRDFVFDNEKGFILNGKQVKILGVCNHHDLGCLGAAVNKRAIERQLEILKEMGCNGIRTAHNPPAPELLDLCDEMGFIVMDETFDMWKKNKSPHDYAQFWDKWHKRDLKDHIIRDRNHPSVFIWSIGNEILEQWDSSGITMTPDLVEIVKELDTTRLVTAGCNPPSQKNNMNIPDVLDIIGYNYAHKTYEKHQEVFPGRPFIATETVSGLMTRGHYDMPSDSIRRWPIRWDIPFTTGNPDLTVSAYDNVSAPWGSTHEETWKIMRKHDYLSGMFIWTGFDYLGEPTPYSWPARSSYFGIIDLAGFPKDVYYMYQSEWTDKDVLHVFPHWNWNEGELIDIVAYTNCDEVELFLNNKSLGSKKKLKDDLRLTWGVTYEPGTIKAIGRTDGKVVLTKEVKTAGEPAKIILSADRSVINANGRDLSFITVEVLDENGILVPKANNLINFKLTGDATIAGVDNGNQTSHESFKANYRKAFNGKCLVVIQSGITKGPVTLEAASEGLEPATLEIRIR
jgi:beta-galactosidase